VEEREGSRKAYTPGPWEVFPDEIGHNVGITIIGAEGGIIADIGGGPLAIRQANARLIAAAPELLAAAGLALAHLRCEYADPAQVAARDALVKAVAKAGGP
jgi:hypothetical protein